MTEEKHTNTSQDRGNKTQLQYRPLMSSRPSQVSSCSSYQYSDHWNVSGWYCCQVRKQTTQHQFQRWGRKANDAQCKCFNTSLEEYCDHYLDSEEGGIKKLCAHDFCISCEPAGEQPRMAQVYRSPGNRTSTASCVSHSIKDSRTSVDYGEYGIGY